MVIGKREYRVRMTRKGKERGKGKDQTVGMTVIRGKKVQRRNLGSHWRGEELVLHVGIGSCASGFSLHFSPLALQSAKRFPEWLTAIENVLGKDRVEVVPKPKLIVGMKGLRGRNLELSCSKRELVSLCA